MNRVRLNTSYCALSNKKLPFFIVAQALWSSFINFTLCFSCTAYIRMKKIPQSVVNTNRIRTLFFFSSQLGLVWRGSNEKSVASSGKLYIITSLIQVTWLFVVKMIKKFIENTLRYPWILRQLFAHSKKKHSFSVLLLRRFF